MAENSSLTTKQRTETAQPEAPEHRPLGKHTRTERRSFLPSGWPGSALGVTPKRCGNAATGARPGDERATQQKGEEEWLAGRVVMSRHNSIER